MIRKEIANAWFILANDHLARLLLAGRTPTGRCCISEVDTIESPFPQFDGGRPYAYCQLSGYSYADNLNAINEERQRFTKQLARWIEELLSQHEMKHLTVFTPAGSIGFLREYLHPVQRDRIDLSDENLMHLTDDALERHCAITSLLIPRHGKDKRPISMFESVQTSVERPSGIG